MFVSVDSCRLIEDHGCLRVNNGICDVACFGTDACENDGTDCDYSDKCADGCIDMVMLKNAVCENACNVSACGKILTIPDEPCRSVCFCDSADS